METWLNKSINVENHYCYSKNRTKNQINSIHSGGISVIVKKDLRDGIKIIENESEIFICIKLDKSVFNIAKDLYVFAIY